MDRLHNHKEKRLIVQYFKSIFDPPKRRVFFSCYYWLKYGIYNIEKDDCFSTTLRRYGMFKSKKKDEERGRRAIAILGALGALGTLAYVAKVVKVRKAMKTSRKDND